MQRHNPLMSDTVCSGLIAALSFSALSLPGPANADAQGFVVDNLDVPAVSGSLAPNLASDGDRSIMSWIEPDGDGHRLRFAVLDGDRWSSSFTASAGVDWFVNWADFPSVVPIHDSLLAAHWLVRQPAGGYAYDIHLAFSTDGGASWSQPAPPHHDGTATEHGFVSLYPHGNGTGIIWLDGRKTAGNLHDDNVHAAGGMTLRSAIFGSDVRELANTEIDGLVCDCCQTDVAVTDDGPIVAYRDRSPSEVRDIYTMRFVDGEWQRPQPVAPDNWMISGCPVNGPAIAAQGTRVALAWFTAANDQPAVRLARSYDAGKTFSTPIDISSGDLLGRVGIEWLPEDGIVVSWLCKRDDARANVCLRAVTADNEVGSPQSISGEDRVPALSVPQLVRDRQGLVAAWTAEIDGRSTIRAARIHLKAATP